MDVPRFRAGQLVICAALAALSVCLMSAPAALAKPRLAFKGIRYGRISHACAAPKPGGAACAALVRVPVPAAAAGEAGVRPYAAGDGSSESGPAGGLTPAQLAGVYGYEPNAGGSGQTLAIVDAYDDPNIESDLQTFDQEYGISACTQANGCFRKLSETGSSTLLPEPDKTGWSLEISLDVEVAHSTCPQCKILLIEARNSSFKDLSRGVEEAAALGATEISNSYGGAEASLGANELAAYDRPGVVVTAAAGDEGYDDWTRFNAKKKSVPGVPNMPASLPSVVAVGGTTLELDEAGRRERETVWNGNGPLDDSAYAEGASGGGCSALFAAQPWQQGASGFAASGCGDKRLAVDVAADANPNTGFDIYDSYDCGEECERSKRGSDWLTIGGTSLSTPFISALYALAGGSNGVSDPALTLYGHLGDADALYDVTEGGNGYCDDEGLACGANQSFNLDLDCEGTTACNAAPGFDGPSGVGAPNSLNLFKPQLPSASISTPSTTKVGLPTVVGVTATSDPYPGGSIASYSWNWGDGSAPGSSAILAHTYAAPGEYTISLSVTDNYGISSLPVTHTIKVERSAAEIQAEAAANAQREAEAAARRAARGVSAFQTGLAPVVPDAQLASTSLQVSGSGTLTLRVSCATGVSSCAGSVSVRTLGALSAGRGHDADAKGAVLTLASGSFSVPGGQVRALTLHLSGKARTLLARSHTMRVRVTLLTHGLGRATHTTQTLATVRAQAVRRRDG
jgi:hypothetical protein